MKVTIRRRHPNRTRLPWQFSVADNSWRPADLRRVRRSTAVAVVKDWRVQLQSNELIRFREMPTQRSPREGVSDIAGRTGSPPRDRGLLRGSLETPPRDPLPLRRGRRTRREGHSEPPGVSGGSVLARAAIAMALLTTVSCKRLRREAVLAIHPLSADCDRDVESLNGITSVLLVREPTSVLLRPNGHFTRGAPKNPSSRGSIQAAEAFSDRVAVWIRS